MKTDLLRRGILQQLSTTFSDRTMIIPQRRLTESGDAFCTFLPPASGTWTAVGYLELELLCHQEAWRRSHHFGPSDDRPSMKRSFCITPGGTEKININTGVWAFSNAYVGMARAAARTGGSRGLSPDARLCWRGKR